MWGHGLVVDLVMLYLQLDSMILRVFSNQNDFMILWKNEMNEKK